MVPELHRILYATDLSTDSIGAIRYTKKFAIEHKANLIIFHVISRRLIAFPKIRSTFLNETQEYKFIREKSDAALKRMENLIKIVCKKKSRGHRVDFKHVEHPVVHYGRIAEQIVEKADMWGCELIVLGSRRKRFLGRIFLPGISRKVIRQTHKPVHIIKVPKGENQ